MAKKEINKKKILLITYIIISLLFIVYTVFNNTKQFIYNVGVQKGQAIAYNSVIENGLNKECKSFQVFSGETAVELVNIKCLQIDRPNNNSSINNAE